MSAITSRHGTKVISVPPRDSDATKKASLGDPLVSRLTSSGVAGEIPYFLESVNGPIGKRIFHVRSSIVIGRGTGLVTPESDVGFGRNDRDRVDSLIRTLHDSSDRSYTWLSTNPTFVAALIECGLVLEFADKAVAVSRLHAMLELRRGFDSELILHALGNNPIGVNSNKVRRPGIPLSQGVQLKEDDVVIISTNKQEKPAALRIHKAPVYAKGIVVYPYDTAEAQLVERAIANTAKHTHVEKFAGTGIRDGLVMARLTEMMHENPDALTVIVIEIGLKMRLVEFVGSEESAKRAMAAIAAIPCKKIVAINAADTTAMLNGIDNFGRSLFMVPQADGENRFMNDVAFYLADQVNTRTPVALRRLAGLSHA